MKMKPTLGIGLLGLVAFGLTASLSGSFSSNSLIHDIITAQQADTTKKIKLPADADPNSDDWKGIDLSEKPPIQPLSPQEEAKLFQLPPGYKIEPVLTEPAIQQPGEIVFDNDGRMYVLELRSYMLDADSKNELEPTSRISRWEDKNNDGVYESGTTFVDKLIFPRFVLPYGKNAILTMESDQDNVYKYTDTNGDGKSDKKELFTNKYGRSGNVEHQQAFLYRGMDNWLYSTVNAFRMRETPNGIIREKTGSNRAQWGIAHDLEGKLWFQGGASGVPSYFQFPIHYGNFDYKDELAKGFTTPWGAPVKIADMQGGMDEVRQPDGSLNRVTGSAGNEIYKGDRLPKDLVGQLFYGEPVARIVRQINPVVKEGLTTLNNVYQDQKSEFLRSTDPLFRPVDMATAPDGSLYVVDMYHGIIQEGQWTPKGSYLRTKIEQYQLDKVVGLGRIWRITHDSKSRDLKKPNMYSATPAQLVAYLNHPNGWWRDAAQQELVARKAKSVIPALNQMALSNKNLYARIHAIWTLEGIDGLKASTVLQLMRDSNPKIRIQAMRAGETLVKNGDKSLEANYVTLLGDPDNDVAVQAMLSNKFLKIPDLEKNIKQTMEKNPIAGVKLVGEQIINPPKPRNMGPFGSPELSKEQKAILERGELTFNELCSQCHGNTGMGKDAGGGKLLAPGLSGNSRIQGHPEYAIRVVLHGLEGAIENKTYTGGLMAPMKDQKDEWVADVVSFIRNGLSNDASFVSPAQVAAVRAKTAKQSVMYKYPQLVKEVPEEIALSSDWKITASHTANTRVGGNVSPNTAFTYEGWSTGINQEKDMYYQIEFPKEVTLSEFLFVSPSSIKRGWRPDPKSPPTSIPMITTFPKSYAVSISKDGQNWETLYDNLKGSDGENTVYLQQKKSKYLRLQLKETPPKGENDLPWVMRSVKVYGHF